jgi:hypothetical protein
MLLSIEYSSGAFIDHLRADRILLIVQLWLEIPVLARHEQYRPEVLHSAVLVSSRNGLLDVGPNIWSVIPIKVNKLFKHYVLKVDVLREWHNFLLGEIFLTTRLSNLIKILLISISTNDIDRGVEIGAWVIVTVFLRRRRQNVVI